jgi:hypothetical protein
MHQLSTSSLAGSLADRFASRFSSVGDTPDCASRALADALAWVNDHEANDLESYPGAGWDDPDARPFDPSPADWHEYAAWSRSLDGGCGDRELSPEERDILVGSATERDYWEAVMEADGMAAEREAELWA